MVDRKICLKLAFAIILMNAVPVFAYEVREGEILDDQGQSLQLRGLNWFGMETSDHVVHGLWARHWTDMISQMKALGFNAIRLPVCPATLSGAAPSTIDYKANPDLAGLNSLQIMDLLIKEFDRQGFYVLLDHHRLDCNGGITEIWYAQGYTEQSWIADLVLMASRYRSIPHFLGIDLKNEPHGSATWGVGNAATDWNLAAERAASAVLSAAPNALIFVEGIGENSTCSSPTNHWWGGNLGPIQCTPLRIPRNRLVLSPHVYGPDVFAQPYFSDASFPSNMQPIWDQDFGQFHSQGYAVAIGETGGKYGHGGQPKDKVFQNALFSYLNARKIAHVFYWSWNPNSGDTGGILQDDWTSVWQDKVDLLARFWRGEAASASSGTSSGSPVGQPVTTPPASTGSTTINLPSTVKITSDWGAGYCANVVVKNTLSTPGEWSTRFDIDGTVKNLWNASYSQSGTQVQVHGLDWNKTVSANASVEFGFCADRSIQPTPTTTPGTSATASPVNVLTSQVQIQSDWGTGYCADVTVTNAGRSSMTWQISLQVTGTISQFWNAHVSQKGSSITASGLDWNSVIDPQSSRDFGFCATR